MKLSKGLLTEIITQVAVVAGLLITHFVVPEYLALAIGIAASLEATAVALVVHFAAEKKIAAMARVNKLTRG